MIPEWIARGIALVGELGVALADGIAKRGQDAEAARLSLVPKLRSFADYLESHPAREQADHDAAVAEATAAELARRGAMPGSLSQTSTAPPGVALRNGEADE